MKFSENMIQPQRNSSVKFYENDTPETTQMEHKIFLKYELTTASNLMKIIFKTAQVDREILTQA